MNNEFVVSSSACSHAEKALEKIKCGLLHQLACLDECKVCGSYYGSCLATKSTEVLPEICERTDCPLATVDVLNFTAVKKVRGMSPRRGLLIPQIPKTVFPCWEGGIGVEFVVDFNILVDKHRHLVQ